MTRGKVLPDFKLRPVQASDLENLVKYANNPKIASNLTDSFPYPYKTSDGEAFIKRNTAMSPSNVMAIELEGQFVGAIGIHPQQDIMRKNAEMGYWLAEPFWGRGIVSEAVKQMVDYGFAKFDIDRIYARPYPHNTASQRILEKAGFKLEARLEKTIIKNGEMMDELIYAIRRQ